MLIVYGMWRILFCVFFSAFCSTDILIKSVIKPIQHGEGPHWDHNLQVLYYVDTFQATALRWDPKTNITTSFKVEERDSIAIIVPVKGTKNEFVVGADRFIYKVNWNGLENNTAKFQEILMVDESKPTNQFNDGKTDSAGRLWIGTLTRNTDQSVTNYGGTLYILDGKRKEERISKVSISNGLAWSENNKKFYYIDSEERNVKVYNFDLASGTICNGEVLFTLSDYPDIEGIPDGMTIDSQNNLWIAVYGGGCILKVDTKTGSLLQRVKMPVSYVTSVAFGGANLDKLYATTSRFKLDEVGVQQQPLAGSVFELTNLGVRGKPANEFVYQEKECGK